MEIFTSGSLFWGLLAGFWTRVSAAGGYRPGGPVNCLSAYNSLGFETVHDCESHYIFHIVAYWTASGLSRFLQIFACKIAVARAQQLYAPIECDHVQDDVASSGFTYVASNSVPEQVIGVPMTRPAASVEVHVTAGFTFSDEASASWDPMLPEILHRVCDRMEKPAAEMFENLATSGIGSISPFEFSAFLSVYEPGIRPDQVRALWSQADRNCDGQVGKEDFCRMFRRITLPESM